jgi:hypothetical protein
MKFDVVLRWPDYAVDDFPDSMYVAVGIEASNYREAIFLGRLEAMVAAEGDVAIESSDDFALVLVLPGNTNIIARGDLTY